MSSHRKKKAASLDLLIKIIELAAAIVGLITLLFSLV
jgi:hypothetical protein